MAFTGRDKKWLRGPRAVGLVAAGAAVVLGLATGGTVTQAAPAKPKPTHTQIQLLAINDFHGNLAPNPATSSSGNVNGTPAGGAEYLSTQLDLLRRSARAQGQDTATVAAGDLIGASPLLSAAFHDEPTIEAMNAMGLDATSVGNHEFDEGYKELLRMQKGGCLNDGDGQNNQNSCPDHKFKGADFKYLSANVFYENTAKTLFAPYTVKKFRDGQKVAFIGMTLENTPNIVTKSGVQGLAFKDEVETANALVPKLKQQGIEAIVVLLHEGGLPADPKAFNSCPGVSGPILDIAKNLDPAIDAILSGHTHQSYNCSFPDPAGKPRLVTSASSFGKIVTEVRLSIDNTTHDVDRLNTMANNHIVTQDVPKDPRLTKLISGYQTLVAPIESKVIGHITTPSVVKTPDDSGESPLGNLIADGQLADPSTITNNKTPVVAFMNPGGIRADLASTGGAVTYGSAFTVQPFNNYLVSMDMTGTQIKALLEQQFSGVNQTANKVLQISGITYTYSPAATPGAKVVAGSIKIAGQPLVDATTYRIVTNNFLSDGGDGFPAFTTATDKFFGGLDIDAFANYLTAHDPYTPGPTDRISIS
ncbi:bifunctional metallophosphatase/5'-nucleotidase [Kribbella qitaiheensis]|uniref:Bifunctional metallophosphatase/5'-nucleotidase n=1 Tax=Kribbella qitaiheensis TaxID=1544730 RepID=A0A7G6X2U0_9ACTN|nr:bifunctional metallophosphatase/5'-nucleotidase [Kribbella qitaiheensis]QNE20555.1 bifunctional metallophosphatase/5'-nucleotidase [Kribbella qitaiheensis]